MAGGTLGAALGIPLGPAGVIGGAALGAAGGKATSNVIEGFQGRGPQTMKEAFKQPIESGIEDATYSMGLPVAGQMVRTGAGKALGVIKPQVEELVKKATSLGVELSPAQAAEGGVAKMFSPVVGVFPFIGTPIRKSQEAAQKRVGESFNQILNEIAPTATTAEIGVDLTKSAGKSFDKFRNRSARLYNQYEKKVSELPKQDIFLSTPIKKTAMELLDSGGNITLKTGETLQTPIADPLSKYIEDLTKLPGNLTFQQIRKQTRDLNEAMTKASADGFDVSRGIKIKKAFEESLFRPDLTMIDKADLPKARAALESGVRANKYFSENIKRFESATAKKFGTVDRNIFEPKFSKMGSKEMDEAFNAVWRENSPQAMKNLRGLVGDEAFNKAARKHIETAAGKSLITDDTGRGIFDGESFAKNLGLDTPEGIESLSTMLGGTKVSPQKLQDFADVVKAVGSVEVPNVSKFISRRVTLGGAKTLGTLTMGGSVIADPITTITLASLARQGSKFISNPKALEYMTTTLDVTKPQQIRNAALLRLFRNLPDEGKREKMEYRKLLREQNGNSGQNNR